MASLIEPDHPKSSFGSVLIDTKVPAAIWLGLRNEAASVPRDDYSKLLNIATE